MTGLFVIMLAMLGMTSPAMADDGGLNNWANGLRSTPMTINAGLNSVAQQKANSMASKDSLKVSNEVMEGAYSSSYPRGSQPLFGLDISSQGIMDRWSQGSQRTAISNSKWTDVGTGVAWGKSGQLYVVMILSTYPKPVVPAPIPVPAPVPAPVIPAPAPVVVVPAPKPVVPAPAPEPVVVEPVPTVPAVEPSKAPVPAVTTKAPVPTVKPSIAPTASSSPSETAVPMDPVIKTIEKRVEVEKHLLSAETTATVQAGIGFFGMGSLLTGLVGLVMVRRNRP